MDPQEFDKLVTRITYSLKPFALSLTHDMDDAKDLLQETAYRAISSQDKYAEGTNLKAWLYTIMKNIFINNYRRRIKHNLILESSTDTFFVNTGKDNNSGEMNMAMRDITSEIDKLTEDYRTPFLMHYEGFKYHEIADHLTLPIGTVKSRIHFARRELKRKLGGK